MVQVEENTCCSSNFVAGLVYFYLERSQYICAYQILVGQAILLCPTLSLWLLADCYPCTLVSDIFFYVEEECHI